MEKQQQQQQQQQQHKTMTAIEPHDLLDVWETELLLLMSADAFKKFLKFKRNN
jgi:hypothetical protein